MRAVLIALPDGGGSSPYGSARAAGGRPVALRQLDFALACGCEEVFALGRPGSPEMALLNRMARAGGAVVRTVDHAHELLGLLGATDELLVLAAGVVPESPLGVSALSAGPRLLVLPADVAVPAGFERVDRDLAWAGAALIPGALIERLTELPPDSDAPAALLRIALQARVADELLPESVLTEGSWLMVEGGVVPARADGWRRQQLATSKPHDWTGRLTQAVLKRWPEHLRADAATIRSLYTGSVLLLALALVLGWYDHPALGLALLAPSALAAALAERLGKIGAGPFARRNPVRGGRILARALDLVLAACGAWAIGGAWLGRIFPPAVLLIALHGRKPAERSPALAVLGDRMVLAGVTALAAALDIAEPVLMLLALIFLVGDRRRRGEGPAA